MPEFKLSALVTISIYTKVEADTLEEAKAIAEDRHIEMDNFSLDGEQEKECWVCDSFDGEPCKIKEND